MDIYVIHNIRDFAFGTPKHNYNKVVEYIKKFYQPVCSSNCKFRFKYALFKGEILSIPRLTRQIHTSCINCDSGVSEYGHEVGRTSYRI